MLKHAWTAAIMAGLAPFFITRAAADDWRYVWANNATSSLYEADPAYTVNNLTPVTISRSTPGRYTVWFNHILEEGAVYAVTHYGRTEGSCSVASDGILRSPAGRSSSYVGINCFNRAGTYADAQFSLLRVKQAGLASQDKLRHGVLGYDPALPLDMELPALRWDTSARPPRAFTAGADAYIIDKDGIRNYARIVSGMYSATCRSSLDGVSLANTTEPNYIHVSCRSVSDILPEAYASVILADPVTYALAYAAFDFSASGTVDIPEVYRPDGEPVSIHRHGAGLYTVTLGPNADRGGNVQMHSKELCSVTGWGQEKVLVHCYDSEGTERDSDFVITAIKRADYPRSTVPVDVEPDGPEIPTDRRFPPLVPTERD